MQGGTWPSGHLNTMRHKFEPKTKILCRSTEHHDDVVRAINVEHFVKIHRKKSFLETKPYDEHKDGHHNHTGIAGTNRSRPEQRDNRPNLWQLLNRTCARTDPSLAELEVDPGLQRTSCAWLLVTRKGPCASEQATAISATICDIRIGTVAELLRLRWNDQLAWTNPKDKNPWASAKRTTDA